MSRVPTRTEIAIGIPVHNGGRFLRQALEALLAQSYADFKVMILDDGSTDDSDAILREYVPRDRRLHHVRLEQRVGMIAAWRKVACLAGEKFRPKYFAWHSDHDWTAVDWLAHLHAAMEASRRCILAHAGVRKVDKDGRVLFHAAEGLDTSVLHKWKRFDHACLGGLGAGDAVYGLFRWGALKNCGVFRNEIMPDRILISEVQLQGGVKYVPEAVRFRRQTQTFSDTFDFIDLQMKTLFPEGHVMPNPYLSHVTCFLRLALQDTKSWRASWEISPAKRSPSLDPQVALARHYHAHLYYYRHLHRFRAPLRAELDAKVPSELDYLKGMVKRNLKAPRLALIRGLLVGACRVQNWLDP